MTPVTPPADTLTSAPDAAASANTAARPADAPDRSADTPARPRGLLGKGAWGLVDQMLISATNFVTMVLLARGLGPASFGAFVMVYMVMQFANSLQSGLILQPHSVLGATRQGRDYARYTASCAIGQIAFACAAMLLVLVAGLVAYHQGWPVASLLVAMAPALAAWQAQEFLRRVLYTEVRTAAAVVNDVVSYGGQTAAMALLWWSGRLTGPSALGAIGITSAAAAVLGAWQLRTSLFASPDRRALAENWQFGKWLGAAEIGYWLSSQIYTYLTGFLLGPAAAGVMKAGYVLFGPLRVIGFFLRTVLPTWFARALASEGKLGMQAQMRIVYLTAVPVLGTYCLLAAVFAEPLLRLLYGDQYAGQGRVVVLYAVFALVAFVASVVAAALRAQRRGRQIFTTQLTALLTLPAGWLLIRSFGVEGAVLGMILTSLVVNFSNWRAYRLTTGTLTPSSRSSLPAAAERSDAGTSRAASDLGVDPSHAGERPAQRPLAPVTPA